MDDRSNEVQRFSTRTHYFIRTPRGIEAVANDEDVIVVRNQAEYDACVTLLLEMRRATEETERGDP